MFRKRWWILVLAIVALVAPTHPAWGLTPTPTPETQKAVLDVEWTVESLYQKSYQSGVWLPLRVTITNTGVDRVFTVTANDLFAITMDVPGGGKKTALLYVYLNGQPRINLALNSGETELATKRVQIQTTTGTTILSLLEQSPPNLRTHSFLEFKPADLPSQALSLDPIDAILVDRSAWQLLSEPQIAAIRAWLAHGGTLLIAGVDVDVLPEDLKPADSGAPLLFDGAAVAGIFGQAQAAEQLPGIQLFPAQQTQSLYRVQDQPLFVIREFGAGRVIASAIALNQEELVRWRNLDVVWNQLVTSSVFDKVSQMPVDEVHDSNSIGFLNNLPSLDLPPLKMLLILLVFYIIIVGPVNHLILKRFDRMALAWITIPALTAIFAALAYGIGAQQRGTDVILNDLVIIKQYSSQTSTMEGYAGVFSPTQEEYALQGTETMALRPLNISWMGGTQNTSDALFSSYPGHVEKFSVSQWTLKSLAYEQTPTNPPKVAIDVRLENNTLRGTLRNIGPYTIHDAAFVIGTRVQKLGVLEPNGEVAIDIKLPSSIEQNSVSYLIYQKELDQGYQRPEGPPRELLMRTQAIDTALTAYATPEFRPIFLGFVKDKLPTLTLVDMRHTHAQTTLFIAYPELVYAPGPMTFDGRWAKIVNPQSMLGGSDFCSTSRGPGVTMTNDSMEVQISFPSVIDAFQAEELRFTPTLDGMIGADGLEYELFNWDTNAWDKQEHRGGFIAVNNPEPYFRSGKAQMRINAGNNNIDMGGWWGCFSPGITIKGTLK